MSCVATPEHVPGEMLVRFNHPIREEATLAREEMGRRPHRDLGGGWWLVRIPEGDVAEQAIGDLKRRLGPSATVQHNYSYRVLLEERHPIDVSPEVTQARHDAVMTAINVKGAWDEGHVGSRRIVVAVIDTGIDWPHLVLGKNHWENPGEKGRRGDVDNDRNGYAGDVYGVEIPHGGPPTDPDGHGTYCSSLIGAEELGVNTEVRVMAIKCFDAEGKSTTERVAAGYRYILEMKRRGADVRVISNSWIGGAEDDVHMREQIDAAGAAGILSVFAAGNFTPRKNLDAEPVYPASFRLPSMLNVAASEDDGGLWIHTGYGPETVHLVAPGKKIPGLVGSGSPATLTGTSCAAALVAGAAALVAAIPEHRALGAAELKGHLLGSVKRVGAIDGSVSSGGIVDVGAAARRCAADQRNEERRGMS